MMRHRLTTSLAGAVLALAFTPVLDAQSLSARSPKTTTPPSPAFTFAVMLDTDQDAQLVADLVDAELIASNMTSNLHLFRAQEDLSPKQQKSMLEQIGQLPQVVFSEPDGLVDLPETGSCSVLTGNVGAQQCTIPFVDGTPTLGEWDGQDNLAPIKYQWANWLADSLVHTGAAVVAVLDTGLDYDHPTVADQVHSLGHDFLTNQPGAFESADALDNDFDGFVDEAYGHGTHIASTITLINPKAQIMPLRVVDSDGNGNAFALACAIFYAVDNNADIINLSLSMQEPSLCVAAAIEYAQFAGVTVISSAGNTSGEVLFPSTYDPAMLGVLLPFLPEWYTPHAEVLSVAGIAPGQTKASFSAFGSDVKVVAPAVDIYGAMPGHSFAWWSGTSQACAVASGVASLLVSVGAGLEDGLPMPVIDLVMDTAQTIDPLNEEYVGQLGAGRVDAWFAAAAVLLSPDPPTDD